MPADQPRWVEVDARRFGGWVDRFAARHGGHPVSLTRDDDGRPVLLSADGAAATCDLVFALPSESIDVPALVDHVERPHRYALLLVRRGGWAVGLVEGERVVASKVGTRYVQGRTKKGGSSQQRFARRRGNQADSVVSAAVEAAPRVWAADRRRQPLTLVTGGDRLLLGEAVGLLAPQVSVAVAARRLDVPDPRRRVLDDAARAACAVRIKVLDLAG